MYESMETDKQAEVPDFPAVLKKRVCLNTDP